MSLNNVIPFECIECIEGGVHTTTSVEEVPQIILSSWLVAELPDGGRHFIGWNETEGEGRVSSKIMSYDPKTRIGKTRSGRTYQLVGEHSINMDAMYVWSYWKTVNNVTDFKDVSEEYSEINS